MKIFLCPPPSVYLGMIIKSRWWELALQDHRASVFTIWEYIAWFPSKITNNLYFQHECIESGYLFVLFLPTLDDLTFLTYLMVDNILSI